MTAYVVTPSGKILVYPKANTCVRGSDGKAQLYTDEAKDRWVADIPATWAVGWSAPRAAGIDTAAEELLADIRSAPGSTLKKIKHALRKFDMRTYSWHP